MKNIYTTIAFVVMLALIPALAFLSPPAPSSPMPDKFTVSVYFTKDKKCRSYSLNDYTIGAVLAQMPADFGEEALKAQAVLARTYIYKRYLAEQQQPTPALHGALISDNEQIYQAFLTEDRARELYGDGYSAARKKVEKAVSSSNEILTFEDEPIIAAYHAASSGNTESSKSAWGRSIPYLISVKSPEDAKLKGNETTTTMTEEELSKAILSNFGITLTSPEDLKFKRNKRGYVTKVTIAGKEADNQEFIAALNISSPCFEMKEEDGEVVFISRGFGHMVGMSQYGANMMAMKGSTYSEILAHYFPKTKLKALK